MGKVQTASRGSTKAFLGGGRSSRSVGKTLRGKKRLRPRKVIERNTKKRGAPTNSKGTAQGETAPHTGIRLVQRQCKPLRFGHRAHKVGYGKVGNGKDAEE